MKRCRAKGCRARRLMPCVVCGVIVCHHHSSGHTSGKPVCGSCRLKKVTELVAAAFVLAWEEVSK